MTAAIVASLVILAAAPGIGEIRSLVQDAFPSYYRLILVSVVTAALVAGVVSAVLAIRHQRRLRYGLIATALAVGTAYSLATSTGNANVDAVERFHFVEYGLLTVLFYRAWRHDPLPVAILSSLLSVFIVGTADEWIQWLVPGRVGEWRDVLLNGVAIGCGLLFSLGLFGIPRIQAVKPVASEGSHAWLAGIRSPVLAFTALLMFAVFFATVHVGYEVYDPSIGVFRSRYSGDQLLALADARREQWAMAPPLEVKTYSVEDQYLAEALWHIQRRNEMDGEGGIWATWKENLILEKYFAPVLEFPTYRTPDGARWPVEQRAAVEREAASDPRPFISDAHPFPIYAWHGR